MYTEGFEQWFKTNKNLAAPLAEWNQMTLEMFQQITEENLEMMSENFSRLSDQAKRLSTLKRPEEFMNALREFINEDISATVENSQKMLHCTMKHMQELSKTTGSSVRQATARSTTKEKERMKEREK